MRIAKTMREWGSRLFALACVACSPPPTRTPLAERSPLRCESLQAVVPLPGSVSTGSSDALAALDPALGWTMDLAEMERSCRSSESDDQLYCRLLRDVASTYTALQERPLDALGASEVLRATYRHTDGVTVMARVLWSDRAAVLVVKVLERRRGPLGWITSRELTRPEAEELRAAARPLLEGTGSVEGTRELLPRARFDEARTEPVRCYRPHGASVRIERLEDGRLQGADAPYESASSGQSPCSDPCCDPESEALSRFFDRLIALVPCSKPARE